jgi:hypothetical protein
MAGKIVKTERDGKYKEQKSGSYFFNHYLRQLGEA